MLYGVLEIGKLTRKIVSVWVYGNSDNFWCGRIRDYSDSILVLEMVTREGFPDGLFVLPIESIQTLDLEDSYNESLTWLVDHPEAVFPEIILPAIPVESEDWALTILRFLAKDRDFPVNIEINRDDWYCGWVREVDEDSFTLDKLSNDGTYAGMGIFKMEDVSKIRISHMEGRRRSRLFAMWEAKKGKG